MYSVCLSLKNTANDERQLGITEWVFLYKDRNITSGKEVLPHNDCIDILVIAI